MEPQESFRNANVDDDIVPTSTEGIIDALARCGCLNLTLSIDLTVSSDRPYTGGGSCDVYRGALKNGTKIAIKSLRVYESSPPDRDSEGEKVLKSAANEIYHWSKLKHDNVLPLMGLAVFRGCISVISGWMENGNLTAYLRLKPDADRFRLCMDVCTGLSYIHMEGMVHGDLKGGNVLVSADGVAMITDFGTTQLRDLTLMFGNIDNSIFSIRWAAPELLEDGGPRGSMEADVYAYGMTALEALTGKVPYHWASDPQVMNLVLVKKELPPRPDIPISNGLWALLGSCWAHDPSERPKARTIGDRLSALISPPDVPFNVSENIIGSATSIGEIVDALAERGCLDLTSSINLTTASNRPTAGGGLSDVYRGALHDGTKIAIKSLRVYESSPFERGSRGQKVLKHTARELYHWSKLKHPNVLSLMGLAIFQGHISMITEWMENGNITSYLKQTPGADRIELCMHVCAGLSYIHMEGMVHGDLKAANVMISPDGTAMIAGFGNAHMRGLTLQYTNTTNTAFSIRWAAPELLEDGGPRGTMEADVYAYGMTVLETLTGRVPYEEVSERRVLVSVLIKKQVPPRPDRISDGLWELLNSCWARVPSERPRITSVGNRLQALLPRPAS